MKILGKYKLETKSHLIKVIKLFFQEFRFYLIHTFTLNFVILSRSKILLNIFYECHHFLYHPVQNQLLQIFFKFHNNNIKKVDIQ